MNPPPIVPALPLSDAELQRLQALPRPLVFTNGVFDLLHRGHVQYLTQARQLGQSLVVGVNSDRSALTLDKGPGRPIVAEADRLHVVGALRDVSLALLFDEATPLALIQACRPDVYVKGGDYDIDALPEAALVRSWGGQAFALGFEAGQSTTSMVERIMRTCGPALIARRA